MVAAIGGGGEIVAVVVVAFVVVSIWIRAPLASLALQTRSNQLFFPKACFLVLCTNGFFLLHIVLHVGVCRVICTAYAGHMHTYTHR